MIQFTLNLGQFTQKIIYEFNGLFMTKYILNNCPIANVCVNTIQSLLNTGLFFSFIKYFLLIAVSLPSLDEQKLIGQYFRQLDNLITLHQRKGKAAVTGCSNDANNSKGVYCKARDFGYKCYKEVKSQQIRCLIAVFIFCV